MEYLSPKNGITQGRRMKSPQNSDIKKQGRSIEDLSEIPESSFVSKLSPSLQSLRSAFKQNRLFSTDKSPTQMTSPSSHDQKSGFINQTQSPIKNIRSKSPISREQSRLSQQTGIGQQFSESKSNESSTKTANKYNLIEDFQTYSTLKSRENSVEQQDQSSKIIKEKSILGYSRSSKIATQPKLQQQQQYFVSFRPMMNGGSKPQKEEVSRVDSRKQNSKSPWRNEQTKSLVSANEEIRGKQISFSQDIFDQGEKNNYHSAYQASIGQDRLGDRKINPHSPSQSSIDTLRKSITATTTKNINETLELVQREKEIILNEITKLLKETEFYKSRIQEFHETEVKNKQDIVHSIPVNTTRSVAYKRLITFVDSCSAVQLQNPNTFNSMISKIKSREEIILAQKHIVDKYLIALKNINYQGDEKDEKNVINPQVKP